ncbi:MAG: dioxygenase, partial [Mesorhizobium sp.]
MTPFHLAFPVRDLDETRVFYGEVLGCAIGRSSATWVDFDLFGHQMSAHLRPQAAQAPSDGKVDGITVPIPHFGAVLLMDDWQRLATRLEARDDIDWLERPMVRFKG